MEQIRESDNYISKTTFSHLCFIVSDHFLQAHPYGPAWLPSQRLLRSSGVRPPLLRIVSRHRRIAGDLDWPVVNAILFLHLFYDLLDELGKIADCELFRVTDVDGAGLVRIHKEDKTINEVVDILERARLFAVTVYGHILTAECLADKIGDDTSIEGIHLRKKQC